MGSTGSKDKTPDHAKLGVSPEHQHYIDNPQPQPQAQDDTPTQEQVVGKPTRGRVKTDTTKRTPHLEIDPSGLEVEVNTGNIDKNEFRE